MSKSSGVQHWVGYVSNVQKTLRRKSDKESRAQGRGQAGERNVHVVSITAQGWRRSPRLQVWVERQGGMALGLRPHQVQSMRRSPGAHTDGLGAAKDLSVQLSLREVTRRYRTEG